jgi:hypothetical protein
MMLAGRSLQIIAGLALALGMLPHLAALALLLLIPFLTTPSLWPALRSSLMVL